MKHNLILEFIYICICFFALSVIFQAFHRWWDSCLQNQYTKRAAIFYFGAVFVVTPGWIGFQYCLSISGLRDSQLSTTLLLAIILPSTIGVKFGNLLCNKILSKQTYENETKHRDA